MFLIFVIKVVMIMLWSYSLDKLSRFGVRFLFEFVDLRVVRVCVCFIFLVSDSVVVIGKKMYGFILVVWGGCEYV